MAEVTATLSVFLGEDVASVSFSSFDFASTGSAETLRGTTVCLKFRHDYYLYLYGLFCLAYLFLGGGPTGAPPLPAASSGLTR